jgi:transposase, IS5 family
MHMTEDKVPGTQYIERLFDPAAQGQMRAAALEYANAVRDETARHDGSQLREVVTTDITASDVWADIAYRSKKYEAWLKSKSRVSRIHRKTPKGKTRSDALRAVNRVKSGIRATVEHVFAQQKSHMELAAMILRIISPRFIRTIGFNRAEPKIMFVNLAYNMKRLIFHERRAAAA